MASGADLIAAARQLLGQPYDDGSLRLRPDHVGTDCSGLIARAYLIATGEQLGPVVSVAQYEACRDDGQIITKAEALGIPGALLFCPHDPEQGYGPNGHVGFSNGDGTTTESTPYAAGGVQVLEATFQPWSDIAGLLPGIDYGTPAPTIVAKDSMIYRAQGDSTSNPDVTDGSLWDITPTELLRVTEVPAGVAVSPVAGEILGGISVKLKSVFDNGPLHQQIIDSGFGTATTRKRIADKVAPV